MPENEVYFLPKRKTVLILASACLISASAPLVLHIVFSGKYTGNSGSWIPFSLLWAVLAIATFLWAKSTKITISKTGLEINGILLKREVRWEDIDQLWVRKDFLLLLLNKPVTPLNSITSWSYRKKLLSDNMISINDFSQLWQDGVLPKKFPAHISVVKLEEGTKYPSLHRNERFRN